MGARVTSIKFQTGISVGKSSTIMRRQVPGCVSKSLDKYIKKIIMNPTEGDNVYDAVTGCC
jgi:hypothetical protein